MKLDEWIESNREGLIRISDSIWSYAELGLLEEKSSKLLADTLEDAEFKVKRGVAGMSTAFVASYGTKSPIIGILGEYDALPRLSQVADSTKKPVEEGAPGHGCGHNLFGTAALAACLVVKEAIKADEVQGTIRFYGCPAEEKVNAKGWMIKAGLFNDVDISLTWHPGDMNAITAYNYQAMYSVMFRFYGRAAHAADDPFSGRSALDAVELMNVGCNYLREHIIPDARIHYVITNGGEAPNIVPAEAAVWYYIRAPYINQVKEIYPRIVKVAKGAALMTETEIKIEFLDGTAHPLPNITLEELLFEKMKQVGPPSFDEEDQKSAHEFRKTFSSGYFENLLAKMPQEVQKDVERLKDEALCNVILPIFGRGKTMGGSTDVADVSWVTPLAQFSSACYALGTSIHSWQSTAQVGMSIGHKGMLHAAKILALSTIELMQTPELVEKARKEFEEKIKKTPYEGSMPDDVKQQPIEYFKKL
ncbi:MAG: M20 family metallopeptidase [Candidatus Hodarchaeota archaeon]